MSEIKRYIVRCVICHRVVRKAKPAKYCSLACKQVAWRRSKAAREAEAEAAAIAEVERQQQRAEALRQQRAEAERQRQQTAQRQQREAERQRQLEVEQQQRAEAVSKHHQHMLKVAPRCPKCGKQCWHISQESTLFGLGKRLVMVCTECRHKIAPTVSPSPCPVCSLNLIRFDLDGDGVLTCGFCEQAFVWGEWLTTWQPGEPAQLAPGHRLDNLKRHRPFVVYQASQPAYRPPTAAYNKSRPDDDTEEY